MCSHSDLWPYKNLPQSDCRDTELLQQEATAAAEEEETLTQTTEHRADSNLTKHTLQTNTDILMQKILIIAITLHDALCTITVKSLSHTAKSVIIVCF